MVTRRFLSFRCPTHDVKLTFFDGVLQTPQPPLAGKDPEARFLDLRDADPLDEALLDDWVRQAAALPGWVPQQGPGAVRAADPPEVLPSARKAPPPAA